MPSLLEPEYDEPFNAWKAAPTPATAGALLKAVRPVIDSAVKSYGGGETSPILVSRARRMALDAFAGYDPARAGLRTHLGSRLQGLRRVSAELNEAVAVPEQARLDRGHINAAENRLRDGLGRDPTDLELADDLGLSARRIARVRGAGGAVSEGALEAAAASGEDPYSPAVVGTDDNGWNDFVYHSLPPTDQLILEHSLGLNGKPVLSGKALAARLGVTPAAVSQRRARIQKVLDQRSSLKVL